MNFRTVTNADVLLLYQWRNDPLTRAMSRTTEMVPYKTHVEWLKNSLRNPNREMFICEHDDGTSIGTLRVDKDDHFSELSWTINPDHRGRGWGKKMLAEYIEQHAGRYRAEVKDSNVASQKMCSHVGFRFVSKSSEMLHFQNF